MCDCDDDDNDDDEDEEVEEQEDEDALFWITAAHSTVSVTLGVSGRSQKRRQR